MLASSYPLLNVFWTILFVFIFVMFIFILFSVLVDLFRSPDLSGWAKAIWVFFLIMFTPLTVLVYLIFRGGSMHERSVQAAAAQDQAMQNYIRQAAGASGGTAEELSKLAGLRDQGVISDAEFEAQKAKLLN